MYTVKTGNGEFRYTSLVRALIKARQYVSAGIYRNGVLFGTIGKAVK